MALPLLANDDNSKTPQTVHASGIAELKTGVPGRAAGARSGAQQSTALEEVQALQTQLQDAQHPEVCTQADSGIPESMGMHALLAYSSSVDTDMVIGCLGRPCRFSRHASQRPAAASRP